MSVDDKVEQACDALDVVGTDRRFSVEEAIEFYQGVIEHCNTWVAALQEDLREAAGAETGCGGAG